ncbi:hypothetical protein AB0C34_29945 [Nocardia sp. NPDC049220]|uniref:hypothetical protein n=1 Tax=Nocardia sp. NPDC049220 TaxID=3155273 RepID=UPI0033DA1D8F
MVSDIVFPSGWYGYRSFSARTWTALRAAHTDDQSRERRGELHGVGRQLSTNVNEPSENRAAIVLRDHALTFELDIGQHVDLATACDERAVRLTR